MDFPDPLYRRMCSQATLHCKDGFFPELLTKVTEEVGTQWIDNVFSKQSLDKDRIRICCSDSRVWNILNGVLKNVQPHFRKKSAQASMDARLQGDKAMKEGSFLKANMLYSQAVIKAPKQSLEPNVDDGLTLSKALRARAQSHQVMHRFQACLDDLHLCLEEGFPEPLKYQIYKSMGDAYFDMREDKRAKIAWTLSLKMLEEQIVRLENTKVKGPKRTKANDQKLKPILEKERDDLKKLLNSKRQASMLVGEVLPPQTFAPLPNVSGTKHEKYTDASSLVSLRRTLEEGRFAVAADDIETGSTLVVEEPYASVLSPAKFASHCAHCYCRLHSPVPCTVCAGLAFCSTKCRSSASYHRYECEYLGLLQGAGISVLAYLSLRMLTQEGFSFFKSLQEKIEALKRGEKAELNDRENKYISIYNLTTHQDLRPNDDYFHRAVMSMFLVQCLKGTFFFPNGNGKKETFSEDEILAASLILRHLQLLQFNAHEMYETKASAKGQSKGSKPIYVAVGVYPTVALFNHECAPAVTRYFHGKNIIIRTVRPLKKGDIISENYGPVYTHRNLVERTRDLTSRYWFKCRCSACLENWPNMEQLAVELIKLRCPTPQCRMAFPMPEKITSRPRCPSCFNKANLAEVFTQVTHYQTLYDRAVKYVDDNKPDMAEPLLTAFLDKIYDISPPPSREIALAQEALRNCFAHNGNIWIFN